MIRENRERVSAESQPLKRTRDEEFVFDSLYNYFDLLREPGSECAGV